MTLADYYFSDPRVVLVPIEHLSAGGISRAGAALLAARGNWSRDRVALLDTAFALYWSRTAALAGRTRTWAPPRARHIAVLRDALAVHPYAQLLNTSAWTLYDADLDPARSHPEFVAYLLAHGDRMARTGEVTRAALFNAAWWFARSDDECTAFAAAAAATARPDGAAFQVLAETLPWLRQLGHETLRPPTAPGARPIPGSELLVPVEHIDAPPQLVDRWTAIARTAVDAFLTAWRTPDRGAEHRLIDWLVSAAPAVLITARGGDVLWDPAAPDRVERLRAELDRASGAAVRDVHADLAVLDRHTRHFRASLVDAAALPAPAPTTEQRGYTFMHRTRRLLAYDLDEPGIDRRHAPALPFARAMLGARAAHEWAHLAVGAGWVPLIVPATELEHRVGVLAEQFDAAIAAAPESVRRATAADLGALRAAAARPAGAALARVLLSRMSDFQANLLAQRYLTLAERETYVRQNVRTLRADSSAATLWRTLARYLFELQHLRFSAVEDRRAFFLHSTWFDADFLASGVLDGACFDALAAAVASICDCYAVEESRFIRPSPDGEADADPVVQ